MLIICPQLFFLVIISLLLFIDQKTFSLIIFLHHTPNLPLHNFQKKLLIKNYLNFDTVYSVIKHPQNSELLCKSVCNWSSDTGETRKKAKVKYWFRRYNECIASLATWTISLRKYMAHSEYRNNNFEFQYIEDTYGDQNTCLQFPKLLLSYIYYGNTHCLEPYLFF